MPDADSAPFLVRSFAAVAWVVAALFILDALWLFRSEEGDPPPRVHTLLLLALVMVLGVQGAATFHYHREIQAPRARAEEEAGSPKAAEQLRGRVRQDATAFGGAIIAIVIDGLAARRVLARKR